MVKLIAIGCSAFAGHDKSNQRGAQRRGGSGNADCDCAGACCCSVARGAAGCFGLVSALLSAWPRLPGARDGLGRRLVALYQVGGHPLRHPRDALRKHGLAIAGQGLLGIEPFRRIHALATPSVSPHVSSEAIKTIRRWRMGVSALLVGICKSQQHLDLARCRTASRRRPGSCRTICASRPHPSRARQRAPTCCGRYDGMCGPAPSEAPAAGRFRCRRGVDQDGTSAKRRKVLQVPPEAAVGGKPVINRNGRDRVAAPPLRRPRGTWRACGSWTCRWRRVLQRRPRPLVLPSLESADGGLEGGAGLGGLLGLPPLVGPPAANRDDQQNASGDEQ